LEKESQQGGRGIDKNSHKKQKKITKNRLKIKRKHTKNETKNIKGKKVQRTRLQFFGMQQKGK